MGSTTKQEKISLRRIIANTFYIIKYALHIDKVFISEFFILFCVTNVGLSLLDTVFVKGTIDRLSSAVPLQNVLTYIITGLSCLVLLQILNANLIHWSEIKLVHFNQKIQRALLEKSSNIDLISYDHPEYFEDFVLAAAQSENMIRQAILCTTYLTGNSLAILSVGALIMTINPVIAIFPVLGFIVNIITRFAITKQEYNYELEQKKIRRKADYSKRVFYQPEYAKEIKLSDIYIPLHNQFESAIEEEKKMAKGYGIRIAILSLINWIVVFTFLSYFCLPLYLGYLALVKMSIALGDVAAMNNAANNIRNQLDATNYALVQFQQVGQYTERFRRFIDYDINIEYTKGSTQIPSTLQELQIRNMSYRYDGAKEDSLHNINMTIYPGEKIAIVGENGAGKTTFVKLLMRLYDPTEGSILYGDTNIKDYSIKEYRDKIGAVFQDYQIYAATLAENVLMRETTKEDAPLIKKALTLADFGEKLASLKEGIHTELTKEFSEEGTILSGGESQKVAIARMFAKGEHLSIAILDEPSSALDPIAEYTLNTNMMESAKHSSIIFISHRLSTTRTADRIYMFEHGRIIEQGTHEELMDLNGSYATMFKKQAENYQLGESL